MPGCEKEGSSGLRRLHNAEAKPRGTYTSVIASLIALALAAGALCLLPPLGSRLPD